MTIAPIVEGESEVESVPILLRRLYHATPDLSWVEIAKPVRVRRDRFLNVAEEFRRSLVLARQKAGSDGAVLVLLDADDDCPATLGENIKKRASIEIGNFPISVVLANREYESWFLASAGSLDGQRGLQIDARETIEAEVPRDAKSWLTARMRGKPYREVLDQPALTATMNLDLARKNSRSFRKLCSDWHRLVSVG